MLGVSAVEESLVDRCHCCLFLGDQQFTSFIDDRDGDQVDEDDPFSRQAGLLDGMSCQTTAAI